MKLFCRFANLQDLTPVLAIEQRLVIKRLGSVSASDAALLRTVLASVIG